MPFDDAVEDASGGNTKTPQGDYLPIGALPVIDQGKGLIGGYTNDLGAACRAALPVVVFGDHTRALKYVDFPFGMGADGVKVLRPKPGIDAKYLYHYLRSLSLTAAGYDRHFKYLKRVSVVVPPLAEQRRIADILDRAETLRAQRRQALAQLDALGEAIFLEMFGEPTLNPKGFPTMPLAALVRSNDTINYGVVQPGDDLDEGIPLVRVGDLLDGRVSHRALKRISPAIERRYKRSRLIGDEILVSCVGTVGLVAIADPAVKGFNIARAIARIPLGDAIDRSFVAAYLKTGCVQRYFVNELRTVSQPTLNIKQLSETAVLVPPAALQRTFTHRIEQIERLKALQTTALAELNTLFTSLQHRAFRGEL